MGYGRFATEDNDVFDNDKAFGELAIAEYVVFLMAYDTYCRYLQENQMDADEVSRHGRRLLDLAERQHGDRIRAEFMNDLPTDAHRKLADRAFRFPRTENGFGGRALWLRTALDRGGAPTQRKVFSTNRALAAIREALQAASYQDADAALDKFAVIDMRNARFRDWIDLAAQTAGSGTFQNPIAVGSRQVSDETDAILVDRIRQQGASAVSSENDSGRMEAGLSRVQADAQEAARKAMSVSGDQDVPPVRSEVVGIATAAAVAAISDPSRNANIPEPLRKLDDEQRAAALTDGKVLVAAGAGAGKSSTVVARVEYLVKERKVLPSRILVTSFNKKAANELQTKIGKAVGEESAKQMSIGTMHGLFRKFIMEFGTPGERAALSQGMVQGGGIVAGAVNRTWSQCFAGTENETPPKAKTAMRYKTLWAGNNISPKEAQEQARTKEEKACAIWYEFYEGFKGSITGWKPPARLGKLPKEWEAFMGRKRPNGMRLADFDDMLSVFRDILKRDQGARRKIQGMFDHLIIDEAQDLNTTQSDIAEMMSEHIGDGSDGKSLWITGDANQAIYGFRGAKMELFVGHHGQEGWKTRLIRTNYRCEPEIVEAANRLIAHNDTPLKFEANPDPRKTRGVGSIVVKRASDEAEAALSVVESIKSDVTTDSASVTDYAILCRTNNELHAYETACIIRGIPYARKGKSSFLGSPETSTFLSYVQMITGDDSTKMQNAFAEVINKPNRFFVSDDAGKAAVDAALTQYAVQTGLDRKTLNPVAALESSSFRRLLAQKLVGSPAGFKFDKAVSNLSNLSYTLTSLRAASAEGQIDTKGIFDEILNLEGTTGVTDPRTGESRFVTQTFRESLQQRLRDATGGEEEVEEDEDDEEAAMKGLGNIGFLYKLAQVDPTEPDDVANPPTTPLGFKAKMDRMVGKMRDLRIDLDKWEKDQEALPPEQRKAPPGVYCGTVHATKGAQWQNVFVQMPKGKFPMEMRVRPGDPPPPPEEVQAQLDSERRLAYVGLTRAAKNLSVVCPSLVGGRPAGVSSFVSEAGLKVGENVQKPGIKTASDYEGLVPTEWADTPMETQETYAR